MESEAPTKSLPVTAALPRSILGTGNFSSEDAQRQIEDFVKGTIRKSDQGNLKHEFNWRFLLETHRFTKKGGRLKRPFLTRKERASCGLLKLPQQGWNYSALQPLRDMWCEYMRKNLDLPKGKAPTCTDPEWQSFGSIAAKSELIGAELKVVRSKVPNQIGITGTLVLETKLTFQIVTPQNKLKTIIKDSSVFEFRLDKIKFIVYGKHITTRPGERSAKKIKSIMNPDL